MRKGKALGWVAATVLAFAASAPTPARADGKPTPQQIEERFKAADKDHDGKLTLDEAKAARMSFITANFDKIDKDKKGYVTLDQVKAWANR